MNRSRKCSINTAQMVMVNETMEEKTRLYLSNSCIEIARFSNGLEQMAKMEAARTIEQETCTHDVGAGL